MPQGCDLDELVKHAMKALSGCVTGDKELDANGLTVAIVGKVGVGRPDGTRVGTLEFLYRRTRGFRLFPQSTAS